MCVRSGAGALLSLTTRRDLSLAAGAMAKYFFPPVTADPIAIFSKLEFTDHSDRFYALACRNVSNLTPVWSICFSML